MNALDFDISDYAEDVSEGLDRLKHFIRMLLQKHELVVDVNDSSEEGRQRVFEYAHDFDMNRVILLTVQDKIFEMSKVMQKILDYIYQAVKAERKAA